MQSNQCTSCRHHYLNMDIPKAIMSGITPSGCLAFPEGVPPEVLGGEVDHRQPYHEDGGVTWELAEGHPNPFDDMGKPDQFVATASPQCSYCNRLVNEQERKCEAFDSIPIEVWNGDVLHDREYPGDGGIQFERAPGIADVLIPPGLRE